MPVVVVDFVMGLRLERATARQPEEILNELCAKRAKKKEQKATATTCGRAQTISQNLNLALMVFLLSDEIGEFDRLLHPDRGGGGSSGGGRHIANWLVHSSSMIEREKETSSQLEPATSVLLGDPESRTSSIHQARKK